MKQTLIEVPIGVVPSTSELSGYLYVEVKIELRKLIFLLDTGSSHTWLSEQLFYKDAYLRNIGEVVPENEKMLMFGVNGDVVQEVQHRIVTDRFCLGEGCYKMELLTMNFAFHDVDGILGFDFLLPNKAIIDLKRKKLTLKL